MSRDPTCEYCARALRPGTARHVEVEHRRTGERRELTLCPACVENSDRAWRLSWRPLTGTARIEGKR